jgi:hypothetical protein
MFGGIPPPRTRNPGRFTSSLPARKIGRLLISLSDCAFDNGLAQPARFIKFAQGVVG